MTGEPDHRELTPAQEAEVRRRLADARHTEPMPDEVADRLDRVLTALAAEPSREARVVRLADRRRRAATILVAAAAVVVAGVGIGQVVGGGGDDSAGEASVPAAEQADDAPAREGEPEALSPGATGRDGAMSQAWRKASVRIRPARFPDDVARLRAQVRSAYDADREEAGPQALTDELRRSHKAVCEPGDWGEGVYRPVSYGRSTGYVVFRRSQGDSQVADLFLCGSDLVARSVTLPSP